MIHWILRGVFFFIFLQGTGYSKEERCLGEQTSSFDFFFYNVISMYLPYNPVMINVGETEKESSNIFACYYPKGQFLSYKGPLQLAFFSDWMRKKNINAHLLRLDKKDLQRKDLMTFSKFFQTGSVISIKINCLTRKHAVNFLSLKLYLYKVGFRLVFESEAEGEFVFIQNRIYDSIFQ